MIKNDEQLCVVREQLGRVEEALRAIRRDIFPRNRQRFELMAEAYIDQIQDLRQQIDEYLGVNAVRDAQADLVISLEGRNLRLEESRGSLITRTLDTLRRGLQALIELKQDTQASQRTAGRRKQWIEQLCDPPLIGIAAGSIRISLGSPNAGELFTEQDKHVYEDGLQLLLGGVSWANEEAPGTFDQAPDRPELRYTILSTVRKIATGLTGPVESIGFAGRAVGGGRCLRVTRASRTRIDQEMRRIAQEQQQAEVTGTIREVDLDSNTFVLRDRGNNLPDLTCEYDELTEADVKAYLDERVLVRGSLRTSPKNRKQTLEVEIIEAEPIVPDTGGEQDTQR